MSEPPHPASGLPDWHNPAPYTALVGIDRAGLMWEWLRRDPAYRSGFAEHGHSAGFAKQWALCFR